MWCEVNELSVCIAIAGLALIISSTGNRIRKDEPNYIAFKPCIRYRNPQWMHPPFWCWFLSYLTLVGFLFVCVLVFCAPIQFKTCTNILTRHHDRLHDWAWSLQAQWMKTRSKQKCSQSLKTSEYFGTFAWWNALHCSFGSSGIIVLLCLLFFFSPILKEIQYSLFCDGLFIRNSMALKWWKFIL